MTKKNANLSKIKKVFSHVHALNQCRENIKKLKIKPFNFIDTAGLQNIFQNPQLRIRLLLLLN